MYGQMPKLILGIDPSLTSTGWAALQEQNRGWHCLAYGCIPTSTRTPLSARLALIYQKLSDVFETYHPDEVAIERTFINNNPSSAMTLGFARGVALMIPGLFNTPVYEYSPNQIKKSLTGYGHSSKSQVMQMMKKILNTAADIPLDASDAMAIALCHGYALRVG
jgi:crossover junction endodeoxyribonuclease RuvC